MNISHIGIFTADLERLKQFYIKYFGTSAEQNYKSKNTQGFESCFVSFDSGARLEIMTIPEITNNKLIISGYSHIAISVGSKEAVDRLTERLQNDGYPIISKPRTTGDGYYESKILDPDGNIIEITE